MPEGKLVYVKADEATQRRQQVRDRARRAIDAFDAARREFAESQAELDRTFGPDPRTFVAEQAIAGFCDQVTGRPSISPR